MPVLSYESKSYNEAGLLYVVVTLDDGATFGQYITPGTTAEMDEEVRQHAARVEAQKRPTPVIQLGAVRMLEAKVG